MALQKCKECGKEISSKAQSCPSCGAPNRKNTGCITLLFLLFVVIGLIGIVINAIAPEPSSNLGSKATSSVAPAMQEEPPFKFLKTKAEEGGRDVMDLYTYSGKFDPATLKAFCLERKSKSTAQVFYYAVIFDSSANARFPTSPFTAEYGIEENRLKHIRAIYCYNRVNGFSELRYHDDNIWDHLPTREKL